MTEFEMQIAEALRTIELSDGIPLALEDAELLAPRVAAAIREAARAALRCGDTTFDSAAVAQQIELAIEAGALSALRGETP